MHFEYAGRSSREFGLIMANVETPRHTSVSGKIQTIRSYRKLDKKNCYIGTSYADSPMEFEAEVVCETPLTYAMQHEIMRWLFHRDGYKQFFVDIVDDVDFESCELLDGESKRTYLNCRFVNPEKLEYNGGVVGYRFTVECDSHLAWQEPIEKIFYPEGSSFEITLNITTDNFDYTYPTVTLVTGNEGGDIEIINTTDDNSRTTKFVETPPNTTIQMSPSTGFITKGFYDKFAGKNFIRLLSGENKLEAAGDISEITIMMAGKPYIKKL